MDIDRAVGIIAFCLALFLTFQGINQQNQIDKINYQRMSEVYRPKIMVAKPIISSLVNEIDTIGLMKTLMGSGHIHMLNLPAMLKLHLKVLLYNRGSSQANFVGYLIMDSVYTGRLLLEKIKENAKVISLQMNVNPSRVSIDKADTLAFDIVYPIINFKQNKFMLHLFLVYENDFHILYSTYTWIEYHVNMPKLYKLNSNKTLRYLVRRINVSKDRIKLININNSPDIVQIKDTTAIRKFFRRYSRNQIINKNKLFPYYPPTYQR